MTLRAPAAPARVEGVKAKVGRFSVARRFAIVDGFAATMTKGQVAALARLSEVEHVEENGAVRAFNNTAQDSFGVTKARIDAGIDGNGDGNAEGYSAADLVAAVIDTGIESSHADLDERKVIGFANCFSSSCAETSPFDDNGHGTHVAATIAGDGDARADRLYKGVAPAAALVGVKVLDSSGTGSDAGVIAGIEWVVANKARFGIEAVNLSLGGDGCSAGSDAVSAAVNNATAAGLVVVVAAGNKGPATCTIGSPAAAANAVTVGAMADLGVNDPANPLGPFGPGYYPGWFSSRGPTLDGRVKPDISAPGVDVTSAQAGTSNGYTDMSGTSMAAPFVAGVALLMLDANPVLTPQQVKAKIMATADDWARGGDNGTVGSSGADIDYGAGRLDAYAAIQRTERACMTSPPAVPAHLLQEGTLSATGAWADFPLAVTTTGFPIAATLIIPGWKGHTAPPDFDLHLLDPTGTVVTSSEFATRQEELGYLSTLTGTWTLRVVSSKGAGDFFLDISGGSPAPAPPAAFCVSDATVTEGGTGTATALFTVTRSEPASGTATVAYATSNGTAAAGSDYADASGTLTFGVGETSKTVAVGVSGDPLDEADETFVVDLANPTNAVVSDGRGVATVIDDDAPPALAVADVTVTESNAGTTALFSASLSAPSGKTVTVGYTTGNGTAAAGSDYGAATATLTFSPAETTKTIAVPVVGDLRDEPNETFYVALGNASNATIADGLAGATIVDDDPPPSVRISNVRVTETNTGGRRARFVVRLSNASAFPITVRFATANGTARAPSDYYAKAATTLNFSPGTTSRVISVWVRGDRRNERNETFFVNLWRGVNATFADRQGRATIVDND